MNAIMMKTRIATSTACRMGAPVSSRPNRIASAQPPANAAPNTSAPIRIGALMTVMTLGQMIWRALVGEGCELMGLCPVRVRNLSEKCSAIKRKRPKKAPSRDIGSSIVRDENGNCYVRNLGNGGHLARSGKPAAEAVADAVRDTAVCGDRAGTFPPRLRAGLRRPLGRDRRDHPRSGDAGFCKYHHGAGALRKTALQGLGGVLRPGVGAFQSGAARDRQGGVVADGAALEPDHDERGAVRPDRDAARQSRYPRPDTPPESAPTGPLP